MITPRPLPVRSTLMAAARPTLSSLTPLLAVALGGALLSACATEPPGVALHSTLLPLSGPCPESGAGSSEMAGEVTRLRIEIAANDLKEAVSVEGGVNEITIEGVPAGENRQVSVFGLTSEGHATWRGVRPGVTVSEGENTAVDVLLARIADLTCTRSPQTERRVFHSATRLEDGRVLLVGGARTESDASASCGVPGCTLLDATSSVEVYDPGTGVFLPAGNLQVPRMFHEATLLPGGRVAISGGTSEAFVDTTGRFPIRPRTGAISLIEVWDPKENDLLPAIARDDPSGPRLFHAATTTSSGDLLLSGGVPSAPPAGQPNDLGNALADTTLCDADSMACVLGPTMNQRRAGHGAFLLDSGDVLIWGGSVDIGGSGYRPEVLRKGTNAFQLLNTAGFNDNRFNLFFAATAQYQRYRVLAAGGLVRAANGTFTLSSVQKAGSTRGAVFVFDAAQGTDGALSAGPYVQGAGGGDVLDALATREPTFFGSAAPLPGGSRAVIAGGFRSLDLTPSEHLDLYSEDPFTVAPLSVGGQPRVLREPRGGLAAVGIGDGTVLFSGGATSDGSGVRTPRLTAEVFVDPTDPGSTP